MEKNSLQMKEEINKLCSLIGNLQRRLDLEYSTPENDRVRGMMREASPVEEPMIPLFPFLEEKRNKGKNKEESPGVVRVRNKAIIKRTHDNTMIDIDNFRQTPINMINLTWAEKGNGKATWEVKVERRPIDRPTEGAINLPKKPKATIIKGVMLQLIKRRNEEEHENNMSIMRAAERETSRNIFQRLKGYSQPKNLSEKFRNYEGSEKVKDKEAKIPKWVDVRLS
ncbi:receptor-like protein 12 [Pyrus ussuriensis x Pyrus communis]|uniref:Receptor-like protein 12 n=1 Tax=Pyrus ussuriensis x Pyrus communis TaxID=2448454 RepID=A0A5N5HNJ1_9ROSA|nr:receptor-like protein 12 [Pyrus ussuriensis x Pyrus communis]